MRKTVPLTASLLPDSVTCVYQGNIFSIYTWPQAMFDGTTKEFEMAKRADTVQAIIIKGDQILLLNDEQPNRGARVCLPGGRVDPEDTNWLSACQREILEETGLKLASWRLIDVQQPVAKIEWFTPLYLATDIIEELPQQVDAGGEKIELTWRTFTEVQEAVSSGAEPALEWLLPILGKYPTLEALLNAPEFRGQEVDR